MKQGTRRAYLSLFNKNHSLWKPTGYSTMGKSREEAEAILNKRVIRPALTITAATTPSTFYEGINSRDLSSGFLNRFVVIPATRGLQKQRIFAPPMKVSKELSDWIRWASTLCADEDDSFILRKDPFALVAPKVIPFTNKAKHLLNDIEEERVKRQQQLEPLGMPEVFQRSREIAQRIALIVALSEEYDRIQARHVEWSWNFVSYYHGKMVDSFTANLDKSPLHRLTEKIAAKIIKKAELGMTRREIGRDFRRWRQLSLRESNEVEVPVGWTISSMVSLMTTEPNSLSSTINRECVPVLFGEEEELTGSPDHDFRLIRSFASFNALFSKIASHV